MICVTVFETIAKKKNWIQLMSSKSLFIFCFTRHVVIIAVSTSLTGWFLAVKWLYVLAMNEYVGVFFHAWITWGSIIGGNFNFWKMASVLVFKKLWCQGNIMFNNSLTSSNNRRLHASYKNFSASKKRRGKYIRRLWWKKKWRNLVQTMRVHLTISLPIPYELFHYN